MNLQPGLYEATSTVNIRREPRIVEGKVDGKFISNRVGQIGLGTQRQIYSVLTNEKNETWGRVSEADSAGIAEWICIKSLNREFMRLIFEAPSNLEARLNALEAWARTQGFGEA